MGWGWLLLVVVVRLMFEGWVWDLPDLIGLLGK